MSFSQLCSASKYRVLYPGQNEVGVWVLRARSSWTPLDCVDFFVVRAQVVHAVVLFQTPDLKKGEDKNEMKSLASRGPFLVVPPPLVLKHGEERVLTFNVMSSEQEARSVPCGSHLIAFTSFCVQRDQTFHQALTMQL